LVEFCLRRGPRLFGGHRALFDRRDALIQRTDDEHVKQNVHNEADGHQYHRAPVLLNDAAEEPRGVGVSH
jgi:hypothetical protein